jgi:iron-sulfur cluster assembly protein
MIKNILRITPQAHNMLKQIQFQHNQKYIEFGIKSGGCSGFQYVLQPCNENPHKLDELITTDDYILKINKDYIFKLIDTKIDYTTDLMGSRFTFENPNSDFSCGCGKSFS